MSLSEEIQQAVETGASVEAVKAALIEDRTKTLISERKQLLSWAMNRLESLMKTFEAFVPDNKTYDQDGNLQQNYSEKKYLEKESTRKKIESMKFVLESNDWVILKGLQDKYYQEEKPILGIKNSWGSIYSNKNGDYFLSADFSKLDLLNNACFTYDSFGKDK